MTMLNFMVVEHQFDKALEYSRQNLGQLASPRASRSARGPGDLVDLLARLAGAGRQTAKQPEQSYSERQLYEAALDRLSREIAAVQRITETEAIKEIEAALAKGPRRGPKPAEEAGAEEGVEEEAA